MGTIDSVHRGLSMILIKIVSSNSPSTDQWRFVADNLSVRINSHLLNCSSCHGHFRLLLKVNCLLNVLTSNWCNKICKDSGGCNDGRSERCDGVCIGNTQHLNGPETDDLLDYAGHCHSNGDAGWSVHYTDAALAQDQVTYMIFCD